MSKGIETLFCLVFVAATLASQESQITTLYRKMAVLAQSHPPRVEGRHLLLTYRDRKARRVGVAFEHEGFVQVHPFTKNGHDIYILAFPLPEELALVRYRLVVDGLWMADPKATEGMRDALGVTFSLVRLPPKRKGLPLNPILEEDQLRFSLRLPEGRQVFLVGEFSEWDPYMFPLREEHPGFYTISLRVRKGSHPYYYLVNGQKMLDPLNFRRATDPWGERVSLFIYK